MTQPLSDEQWEQIDRSLYAGKKIEAIKLFREVTGCGLKEAKGQMDDYEKELRATHPQQFTRAAGQRGCLLIVMGGVFLVGLVSAASATIVRGVVGG